MKKIFIFITTFIAFNVIAQDKNIRYEYKKHEKFDLDEIGVQGEAGSPGDISINPRTRDKFKNQLPEKKNFNKEMRKAVQGIR